MSSYADHRTSSDLPSGWKWTTLGEVAVILDSQRVPINADEREQRIASKKPHEVYPYFGATGQVGWIDDYLFDEELVLLGEDGAPFLDPSKSKAYIIKGRSWVNNHAHVLRANAGLTLNSYLMHLLNLFDYHGYVTGTTRLKLNQSEMRKIPIPLAPLPEQHRIVAEIKKQFTRLDAGVTALKRLQANLKRYRASVLKAACEGRLAPQDPADEPADRLLARILVERRAKWEAEHPGKKYVEPVASVTDGLPELPERWCWARIGDIFDVTIGGTPSRSKAEYWAGDVPWVSSGEVAFNRIKVTREHITREGLANSNAKLHPPGTVLLAMIGEGKTRGQAAILETAATTNQNIASLLVSETQILSGWIFYWLESRYEETRKSGSGGMQYALNSGRIKDFVCPVPPVPEQHRIVAELERRLSVVTALEAAVTANLARAGRLRQAVLKRAFEGRMLGINPQ